MAVSVVTFVGSKAEDAETAAQYNTGSAVTDAFYEGTQSVGQKTSATLGRFYSGTLAGGPYDFSSGGSDEGEHIFAAFNALTPTDSFRIIIGESLTTTTDSLGEWDVGPPAGYSGGWAIHVIDPTQDFSRIITAGDHSWTTTGNPAQLDLTDIMGQALNMTTMISGNFANALVDTVSVGLGYKIVEGSGASADAVFADFITFEETVANAYAALQAKFGILFPLCGLFIGQDSGATDTDFTDSGFSVVWPTAVVAVGFYNVTLQEDSGATNVTWTNGLFSSESNPVDFNLDGITDATLSQVSMSNNGGNIQLDGNVDWQGGSITGGGYVDLGGQPVFSGINIFDPIGISPVSSDAAALIVHAANELDNVDDLLFDGAGLGGTTQDAAIELDISGAGPFTINLDKIIFQNKVSGSVHVHILANGNADYVINILNSGTGLIAADVTNDGSGSVTINNAVTIQVTDVVPGSKVVIIGDGGAEDGVRLLDQPAIPTAYGYFIADGADHVETLENVDVSSASGDFEAIAFLRATDMTPPSTDHIIAQDQTTDATRSLRLSLLAGATLQLAVSDGTSSFVTSNVLTTADDNDMWVRAVWVASTGTGSFFESADPEDTHHQNVSWTARGTPTTTARSPQALAQPMLIGARNDLSPEGIWTGRIAYVGLWIDGTAATGKQIIEADWRTGQDFDASDQRGDEAGIYTWEMQGTSPAYNVAASALLTVSASFNYTVDQDIIIRVRNSQHGRTTRYIPLDATGKIEGTGFTRAVNQLIDPFV